MTSELPRLQKYDALDGKTLLICVGGTKCATSWLHRYLGEIPEVAVSPVKELHFFDAKFAGLALSDMDILAFKRFAFHFEQEGSPVRNLLQRSSFQASVDRLQMIYDDDAYFHHFARLCTPETRVICDITPAYSVLGPDGFAYMREFCASQDVRLRLLFVMRDPVDRLWSQLRHMAQVNPQADLTAKWSQALEAPRIMARADYRGTVWDLDETFPAADLLYLFYEDLFGEPALRRLCDFAGVPYRPGNTEHAEHETELKIDLPDDARMAFRNALEAQYAFCRDRFDDLVPSAWQD